MCNHLKWNSYKQNRTNLEQGINELQLLLNDSQQNQRAYLEQLVKQREIAAQAEGMKKQLDDEKIQLENICQE